MRQREGEELQRNGRNIKGETRNRGRGEEKGMQREGRKRKKKLVIEFGGIRNYGSLERKALITTKCNKRKVWPAHYSCSICDYSCTHYLARIEIGTSKKAATYNRYVFSWARWAKAMCSIKNHRYTIGNDSNNKTAIENDSQYPLYFPMA